MSEPNNTLSQRSRWILGKAQQVADSKDYIFDHLIIQMLNKTLQMFEYDGLPDTIPRKDLETILQVGGYAIIKDVDGSLYAFTGGLGGKPNPYYLPTIATVSNPALNFTENLDIDENCVVILNDYMYEGVMPTFNKYASFLTEAELSLRYAILNARIPALIQADNDTALESAQKFIDEVIAGHKYGIISSNGFFDGIKTQDFLKQTHIKDIIEGIQYIKGSWYQELGLNAAYNMKREAINEFEAGLNEDILVPLIDCMLECRTKGLEKVNAMYGTNITVRLSSIWATNRDKDAQNIEHKEAEIEVLEAEAEDVYADEERTEVETTTESEVEEDVTERDTDTATED